MHRGHLAALAAALLLLPAPAVAQSPDPGPDAVALVRATDPRFADLPTLDEQRREMARSFDWAPILAASWIASVPTFAGTFDGSGEVPSWIDTGVGRFVEVMLVDGCVTEIPDGMPTDPCTSREDLLFHVASDGTITTIASSSTPAAP